MSEHPPSVSSGSTRLIILGLVLACVISLVVPTAIDLMASADPHHEGDSHRAFDYESVYGFHALFGFAAYATIVLTAKLLRKVLMRPEEYYD
jgi:hypothetical protein